MVTSLIYGIALSAVAVLTIIWFNPGMAEANAMRLVFSPPPPPPPQAPVIIAAAPAPVIPWIPPVKPPATIADPTTVPPTPPTAPRQATVIGAPDTGGLPDGIRDGIPGGVKQESDAEPPPPPATPAPTPKATPTPAPTPEVPKIVPVSSVILQGKAIRKVQPPYPQIARQARAQGAVPVQITISEEGRVIDASVVGGHPLLRDAARQAALQWAFSPTILNGRGVKVSGVISFNFILN